MYSLHYYFISVISLVYYYIAKKVTLINLYFTTPTQKHESIHTILQRTHFKMNRHCKILDKLELNSVIIIIIIIIWNMNLYLHQDSNPTVTFMLLLKDS